MKKQKIQVQNMETQQGSRAVNQFELFTPDGKIFGSYSSVIVFKKTETEKIFFDKNKWDYSCIVREA